MYIIPCLLNYIWNRAWSSRKFYIILFLYFQSCELRFPNLWYFLTNKEIIVFFLWVILILNVIVDRIGSFRVDSICYLIANSFGIILMICLSKNVVFRVLLIRYLNSLLYSNKLEFLNMHFLLFRNEIHN